MIIYPNGKFKPLKDSLQVEEFVEYLKGNARFFNSGNRLFVFNKNKRCFRYVGKAEALQWMDSMIAHERAVKVRSSTLNEVYNCLVRDSTHNQNLKLVMNEAQYYLNVGNGVLDLRNLRLLSGTEAENTALRMCFTYHLDFEYRANADLSQAPAFRSFLETSLDGSERNPKATLLLEIIGVCLSSLMSVRKFFFLVGATKSGKSVIADFMHSLIWPETAVSVFGINELSGRFNMRHLENSRLNICRELTADKITGTDTIKKIVSEEPLFVEGKGKEGYVAEIHTKLFTCANQMPLFGEMDSAGNKSLTDRMVLLRFSHTISEEKMDRELVNKLISEKDVICSLAVKALNELIKRKYIFTLPEDSKTLLEAYINESVSLQSFLDDWCVIDPEGKVHKQDFISRYREYCVENALKPYSDKQVSAYIEGNFPTVMRRKFHEHGRYLWGWTGIKLKSIAFGYEENDK